MNISELSIRRPVLATVLTIIILCSDLSDTIIWVSANIRQ